MTYQSLHKHVLQWGVAILLGTISVLSTAAEQNKGAKNSPTRESAVTRSAITYKPPLLDTPKTKTSGNARGTDAEVTMLQVFAPDHVGLTTQAQPTLYWYERTPVAVRFELKQTGGGEADVLLQVESDSKKIPGIQQLGLGEHNISLQVGAVYEWSVTLVMDESGRSKAVLAIGNIQRIEPGEGLTSRIEKSHGVDLVDVYAIEGIWYDALETISSMIDKSPEDKGLAAIRTSLLEQVGLQAVAGN